MFFSGGNSYYEKFVDGRIVCIDDEIPFQIPQSWEWVRIGCIYNHSSGKQQSASNKSVGTLRKYITTSNLYWGYFVLNKVKEMFFSDEELESCSAKAGDLLVCEGGAGYGRSAIWDKDYDICLQNHVHRLRPIVRGVCEYTLFYIYLLKESGQLESVGTAMPGLSANRLKSILIPFPPLSEQKRIVAKLNRSIPFIERYGQFQEKLDDLNDSLLNNLKKSILQQAIQGKLVPQDPNDEFASSLLNRIQDEKFKMLAEGRLKKKNILDSVIYKGEDNKYYEKIGGKTLDITEDIPFDLPESWSWCRLSSIVHYRIGKTPARGETAYWEPGTIPWVSISDMKDYGTVVRTKESVSPKATSLLGHKSPRGTLLMSFKLTVGRTAVLDIDAYHNEAIISIWPFGDSTALQPYLFYTLPVLANLGDSKDAIKGKTLNTSSINNLLIPLPPSKEQIRIVNRIKDLYRQL